MINKVNLNKSNNSKPESPKPSKYRQRKSCRETSASEIDYRDLLKAEFKQRKLTNPYYSLRQFAQDLDITPMHLSYLFKNQRGLSKKKAAGAVRELGLRNYEAQVFRFLVSSQSGRSSYERNISKQGLKRRWYENAKANLRRQIDQMKRALRVQLETTV